MLGLLQQCATTVKFFFFRVLIVASYLKIPEINSDKSYAGSGFTDFTSIIAVLNYDEKKLAELVKKNKKKILELVDGLY